MKDMKKMIAAVMVLAVALAGAIVVFDGTEDVDATDNDTTYISGTITAGSLGNVNDQVYKTGSKVIVNGDLTIPKYAKLTIQGANLTVNEGVTITIEAGGQLEIKNDASSSNHEPLVLINGNIVAEGIDGSTVAIINTAAQSVIDTSGVFVSGAIALNKGAKLGDGSDDSSVSGNITVLSGGSISVTKKNSDVSMIYDQNVFIAEGVEFTMAGYASDVTITAYTGSDKYYQTSKIVINDDAGNTTLSKKVSSITVKTTVKKSQAIYRDGSSFSSNNTKVTIKNYVMDVSGTVRSGDEVKVVPGVNAYTDGTTTSTTGFYYNIKSSGTIDTNSKIVSSASITSELVFDEIGKVNITAGTVTTVSGDITIAYETVTSGSSPSADKVIINGNLIVEGTVTANWDSIKDDTNTTGTITVKGGTVSIIDYVDIGQSGLTPTEITNNTKVAGLYGAYYTVENVAAGISVTTFCDLKVAIEGAVAANVDEVVVYAGKISQTQATPADALSNGAYVIEDGTTIPNGMSLQSMNALYVPKDATMTFEVGSEFTASSWCGGTGKTIYVVGKLVDKDQILSNSDIYYEVSKYTEDSNVTEYTTLNIALAGAVSGDVITLVVAINIDDDLTIPEGVIVKAFGRAGAITVSENKTLTIDGTLYFPTSGTLVLQSGGAGDVKGKVIVNGMIASIGATTSYRSDVSGAYYDVDYKSLTYHLITSADIAAEKSSKTAAIDFFGKISAGDLTFIKGSDEDALRVTVNGELKAGKIILNGSSIIIIGETTAQISIIVTGGQTDIVLSKAQNISIETVSVDDGESVTVSATMGSYYNGSVQTIKGVVTVQSGEVSVVSTTTFFTSDASTSGKLIISEDAKLIVDNSAVLRLAEHSNLTDITAVATFDIEKYLSKNYTFIIDGIVDVKKGTIEWGITDVNGQLNILKDGRMDLTIINVDGSVVVDKKVNESYATVEIAVLNGKIDGAIKIDDITTNVSGFILAYPGSDVSSLSLDVTDGVSAAEKTEVYLNGNLFFTVYAEDGAEGTLVNLATIDKFINEAGLDKSTSKYYSDAALIEEADVYNGDGSFGTLLIGSIDALYVEMQPATVGGIISTGTGLNTYIDGLSLDNIAYDEETGRYSLSVGEHVVTFDATYGYDKTNAKVTFNGQTVGADGKIIITADMKDFTIIVSGAVPAVTPTPEPTPTPVEPTKDDSMGITEYLLIVLVVLAAILVVVVAIRMMRS